ncbi:RISC-loading complex subunit tarbp2-like [Lycorma delicatula]|uniref:RISC-loading complex subunit tarbp2-like n=1 Tax=Lycorma delicatula TaxID=130591 RepID=UPI003F512296
MSKTPVSMLQEYCARISVIPQYDLVINGVGTHDPLFRYKLTVCAVVVYGNGKSKKEAKHDAARQALTLLPINQPNSHNIVINNQPEVSDPVEDITSPYHGALKENAIGQLTVICSNNKLPEPEYDKTGEEGPPHAKLFTFQCRVANLIENASSRTKKQAKHLSAKNMIERLKTVLGSKLDLTPTPVDTTDSQEKPEDIEMDEATKSVFVNFKSKKKFNENFDLRIADYHKLDLNQLFINNCAALRHLFNYSEKMQENRCDPLVLLENLFNDTEVGVEFKLLPSKSYFFSCELDSSPFFVVFGTSNTEIEAKKKAAHMMLLTMKEFCTEF